VAELWSHLREAGIESLADVKSACLESDGKLSVIRFDPKKDDPPPEPDRKPGR